MGKFDGKKLLVLGTSVGSVEIVEYAKSEGAYVIVTDYLPIEQSAAKRVADETAMISTTEIDELCKFAESKGIDGVFCGVSEVNLSSAYAIANKFNLPCYFTKEQWDVCQDKAEFHNLCERFDIPVPKKYNLPNGLKSDNLDFIHFPVIVKPVDQGAGIGIHICGNKEELIVAYKDAYEKSYKHEVIVEDYVVGDEFSAAYNIINGEFKLSIMGDKYLNRSQDNLLPLPDAYVYPSKHLDVFIEKYNDKIIEMFKSIGLKNGTVFVQGIANGDKFFVFEAGLRMGGTALYRFVSKINNSNILQYLTDYSLLGKIDGDISNEDPTLKGKRCCLLSLLNGGGKIKKISGVDKASKLPGVVETIVRYNEGETILRSGTLKQSHIRFFVVQNSAEELKDTIEKIQKLVSVTDVNDREMLLPEFNALKLLY